MSVKITGSRDHGITVTRDHGDRSDCPEEDSQRSSVGGHLGTEWAGALQNSDDTGPTRGLRNAAPASSLEGTRRRAAGAHASKPCILCIRSGQS